MKSQNNSQQVIQREHLDKVRKRMDLKHRAMELASRYQHELGDILTKENRKCHKSSEASSQKLLKQYSHHFHKNNDSELDLSRKIWLHWIQTRPSKYLNRKRRIVLKFVGEVIRLMYSDAQLNVYGSVASGLDDESSDIDVGVSFGQKQQKTCQHCSTSGSSSEGDCNCSPSVTVNGPPTAEEEERLQNIASTFSLLKDCGTLQVIFTPRAKVPIVTINELLSGIQIDLSLKSADLKLKIFKEYMRIDERVLPFLKILKHWAKRRDICNAFAGYINSFGYCCLGIAYLQTLNPPILPNLQNSDASKIGSASEYKGFGEKNQMSVGELLSGFFQDMTRFDYENTRVSILHDPPYLPKERHLFEQQYGQQISDHCFVIEDPFEPYCNFSRHVRKQTLQTIRGEFERAVECLKGAAEGGSNKRDPLGRLCEKATIRAT